MDTPQEGNPVKGITLVILATLAFALSDVVTKQQTMRNPVAVVIAVRYIVNFCVLTLILYPQMGPKLWHVNRKWLVIARGLVLAMASLTMGFALRVMPIGETIAIMFIAPFVVMILSSPILGEKVPLSGWLCAAAGFCGVLLIMRPGGNLPPVGVALALTNMCFAAAYTILTRLLSRTESTVSLMWYSGTIGMVFFSIGAVGSLGDLSVTTPDLGMMLLLGILATGGHFLFTSAFREAPAATLAPINYVHLVWAGILGFVFFDHAPDHIAIVGMALVFGSGVVSALIVRHRRRNQLRHG